MNELKTTDLDVSTAAAEKFAELIGQVEEDIEGVRIFAQPGGCSGMSFGMAFDDKIHDNDLVGTYESIKVIVGADTIEHLRGAQVDFVDSDNGDQSFVFNNIPQAAGGGCGTCGSAGGGCS